MKNSDVNKTRTTGRKLGMKKSARTPSEYCCPICGKADDVVLWAESNFDEAKLTNLSFSARALHELVHFKLMRCRNCDLLFSVDVEDISSLASLYVSADYSSANEARLASATYAEYLSKMIPTLPKSALDIGTGEGSFISELKRLGVGDVVGIEPSIAAINCCVDDACKALIINDFFPSTLLTDKKFDLVTLFQTIEHIPDPVALMQNIYNILEANGKVFIVCHDRMSLLNRILGKKSLIYDAQHLQLFSAKPLLYLANMTGFADIRVFHIKNRYPLSYWIKLLPLPIKMRSKLVGFVNFLKIGKVNIPIYAGNIALIATKAYNESKTIYNRFEDVL